VRWRPVSFADAMLHQPLVDAENAVQDELFKNIEHTGNRACVYTKDYLE